MKPKISLITLGVTDLKRALTFYRDGLGFSSEGDTENIVFLKLAGIGWHFSPASNLPMTHRLPRPVRAFAASP